MKELKLKQGAAEGLIAMALCEQLKGVPSRNFIISSVVMLLAGLIKSHHMSSNEDINDIISKTEIFLEETLSDLFSTKAQ